MPKRRKKKPTLASIVIEKHKDYVEDIRLPIFDKALGLYTTIGKIALRAYLREFPILENEGKITVDLEIAVMTGSISRFNRYLSNFINDNVDAKKSRKTRVKRSSF